MISEISNGLAEDVSIVAIVVSELKLGDIQRQIFGADFMKRANNAALEDRPEAFDRVGVDRAHDVLALAVINNAMRELAVKLPIAGECICAKQAYLFGNRTTHEGTQGCPIYAGDNASNNFAFALNGTNDRDFTGTDTTSAAAPAALVFVPVLGEPADESFINFHNSHELPEIFVRHSGAETVSHVPSSFERAEIHHAPKLASADAFLANEHQMQNAEPVAKRFIRVLEDSPADMRKAVVGVRGGAGIAVPVPLHCAVRLDLGIAAAWAGDIFRPAALSEVEAASILVREGRFPLRDGHLLDLRRLFCAGHLGAPSRQTGVCHAQAS